MKILKRNILMKYSPSLFSSCQDCLLLAEYIVSVLISDVGEKLAIFGPRSGVPAMLPHWETIVLRDEDVEKLVLCGLVGGDVTTDEELRERGRIWLLTAWSRNMFKPWLTPIKIFFSFSSYIFTNSLSTTVSSICIFYLLKNWVHICLK